VTYIGLLLSICRFQKVYTVRDSFCIHRAV
jgi:hypothetical protein